MNISVIISVWKRPVQLELILSELDSQAKDNSLHLEVIVSDSHSGKEIDDVVADNIHKKKNINIIHQHTKIYSPLSAISSIPSPWGLFNIS